MIVATAPGKIILFGEHAVCFGKKAIATAVDRRTCVEIIRHGYDKVTVNLADFNYKASWNVADLRSAAGGGDSQLSNKIEKLVETASESGSELSSRMRLVVRESIRSVLFLYMNMAREFGDKYHEVDMNISSSIPIGAGLGSSAAFSVAVSAAFLKLFNDGQDPDLDLVNKWAFKSEQIFHGKPSGIDNSTSTYGGTLSLQDGDIQKVINMRLSKLILVQTKVQRNTKQLVNGTIARRQKFPEIIGKVIDAIGDISQEALTCLTKPEIGDLKVLVEVNQHLLNALGAGHPVIDEIIRVAKRHGLSGKLTGAGGGGCVIVFPEDSSPVQEMLSELNDKDFHAEEITVNASGVSFE